MKINIFKIPKKRVSELEAKIHALKMRDVHHATSGGWQQTFYLSTENEVDDIPWVNECKKFVTALSGIKNVIHYAVNIFNKGDEHFAVTHGKGHFYVRPYCDHDFGLNMAKRIADENDIKQKATKRFSGREKKGIKSFVKGTRLDSESGESIDYLSASIIDSDKLVFGDKSKFGSSLIVSRDNLNFDEIHVVLEAISDKLKSNQRFDLPKTSIVTDPDLVAKYNAVLLGQISNDITKLDTSESSYDVIGTDFVFHTDEKYVLSYGAHKSESLNNLTHTELKQFIEAAAVPADRILGVQVDITNDRQKTYQKKLADIIEFMVPNENVVLENGKWKQFNSEYVEQINESVDAITIEPTERGFLIISGGETSFNSSAEVRSAGYMTADKNFDVIKIGAGHTIEAWDLQKDGCAYAVKFGSSQKLIYVCSQAMTTLDVIRNNANLKKLTNPPKRYCLWLGFELKNIPSPLSTNKSITLKLQLDAFARKCREVGMEPVIKISKHEKQQHSNNR